MFLVILALSAVAFGQTKYKTYNNARFGYSISYPSDLLSPQGEADNGDGQIFLGDGAEMRVFGSNLLLNESLQKEYNTLVKQKGKSVTYKVFKTTFSSFQARKTARFFIKNDEKFGRRVSDLYDRIRRIETQNL